MREYIDLLQNETSEKRGPQNNSLILKAYADITNQFLTPLSGIFHTRERQQKRSK